MVGCSYVFMKYMFFSVSLLYYFLLFHFHVQVKNECVQVVVRCRPLSKKEQSVPEYKQVVEVYPARGVIEIQNPNEVSRDNRKMFTYDAVYDRRYV